MQAQTDIKPVPVDLSRLGTEQARRLATAWDGWRGPNLLPSRADLELDGIKDVLSLVMLLEVQSAEAIVFRLAGSMIDAFLGVSVTGTNFLDYAQAPHRTLRAERMLRQVAQPCGARSLSSFSFSGGYEVPIEIVALPVRPNEAGRAMQLIAVAAAMADHVTLTDPTTAPLRGGAAVYEYFDIGAGVPAPV